MARENLSSTYAVTVFTFKLDYLEAVNRRVLVHNKPSSIDRVESVAGVEELHERIVLSDIVFILVLGAVTIWGVILQAVVRIVIVEIVIKDCQRVPKERAATQCWRVLK